MRIAKYPPMFGVGFDKHGKLAPTMIAPAALPPGPSIFSDKWAVVIATPVMAEYVTGKWSKTCVKTEGIGAILWQHDWGPLQVHIPIKPPYITPSLAMDLLGSSVKYFLPSFSVKETVEGAAAAKMAGGDCAVAVSTPAYLIPTEDCHDLACAKSFNAPSSICFQLFSTRWVGFNFGDVFAGVIGVVGDALSALILSHFGGKLMKGLWDNMLFGTLANSALGFVVAVVPAYIGVPGVAGATIAGFVQFMRTPVGVPGGYGFLAAGLAAPVAWVFSQASTAVGDSIGSKPEDAQPLPGAAAPPAAAPTAAPPPTAPSAGPPPPAPSQPPPQTTPAPQPGNEPNSSQLDPADDPNSAQ